MRASRSAKDAESTTFTFRVFRAFRGLSTDLVRNVVWIDGRLMLFRCAGDRRRQDI